MADPRAAQAAQTESVETSHWLPEGARVIALVRERSGGAWAAGVAMGLADIIGRRRGRTFLANTVPGRIELDGLMDASEAPGITRTLSGELGLSGIARSAPQQSFAYLPAGTPALPLARLREVAAFRRLLQRIAERGGTVLLYLGEEDIAPEGTPDASLDLPVDGCIAIGDVDDPAFLVGAPLLARVERPAGERPRPGPVSAESGVAAQEIEALEEAVAGDVAPAADGPRARRDRRFPAWVPWVGGAAALLAGLGLAWLAVGRGDAGTRVPDSRPGEAEVVAQAGGAGSDETATAEGEGDDADAGTAVPAADAADLQATDLPYSVLVASFARPEDAERHLRSLGDRAAGFLVAPTPIRGRVYWRILAGAREDRVSAESLMVRLVDDGAKERVREWDIRPVSLAWLVGVFDDADGAEERIATLGEMRIPAYRLSQGGEPERFAVYAGAFESEEAAAPLGEMLREAGEDVRLVTRRGSPR